MPVWAISRLRMVTDGSGVTTLVTAQGCPLRCRYCLNPVSWNGEATPAFLTPEELYEQVRIDDLYFQATGGGVTFGGGEPLLYPDFIADFRALCPKEWKLRAETSLHVPRENLEKVMDAVDEFFVDIKDMNPAIYESYTGKTNRLIYDNLTYLLGSVGPRAHRGARAADPRFQHGNGCGVLSHRTARNGCRALRPVPVQANRSVKIQIPGNELIPGT